MCKSYQAMGQRDMALVLAQGVVREDRQCLDAMMEYAKLTYALGDMQASEAAVILLTCLVQKRGKTIPVFDLKRKRRIKKRKKCKICQIDLCTRGYASFRSRSDFADVPCAKARYEKEFGI